MARERADNESTSDLECVDVRQRLGEWIDARGEASASVDASLDTSGRSPIQRHLEICAGCRAEEEALREVWRALDEVPPPAVPEDDGPQFLERVHERIVRERVRRSWRVRTIGAAAAAVLIFAATVPFLPILSNGSAPDDPILQDLSQLDASVLEDLHSVAVALGPETLSELLPREGLEPPELSAAVASSGAENGNGDDYLNLLDEYLIEELDGARY